METQTKRLLQGLGLVGLITTNALIGIIEPQVFDRQVGEEHITLTEGFDMVRYSFTKMYSYKQTLTVSNANHEVFIFHGRPDGTLLDVEHTESNGSRENYSKYSDKIKPFEKMFREYQNKIQEAQK